METSMTHCEESKKFGRMTKQAALKSIRRQSTCAEFKFPEQVMKPAS